MKTFTGKMENVGNYAWGRKKAIRKAKKKSKKRKETKAKKFSKIQNNAGKLNRNLPASEHWFQARFKQLPLAVGHFYNVAMTYYIPDCINFDYRYIIEIDGSIHALPEIQLKDRKKNEYFESKGYKVFRIQAFNDASYNLAITQILEHRNSVDQRSHKGTVKKTEP